MKTITIVGFGDSITMDCHVEDEEKRWLSLLERMLSEEYPNINFNTINSGVGGNSDREKMTRYEYDVLAHAPDVLLIQFGGNNSGYNAPKRSVPVQETEEYLQQIKNTIPDKSQIVVITFPHVLWQKHKFYIDEPEKFIEFYKQYGGHEARLNQYRETLKSFATKNNYPIVDLYKAMKESNDVESLQVGDGVHLNAAGDQLLAELVFKALDSFFVASHNNRIERDFG